MANHAGISLAYYLGVPLVILFLKATFPRDVSKKANFTIQTIALGFACLVLLTPARIFTHINPLYQVFSIAVILFALYVVIISCFKKSEGAYLIGVGVAVLILFALNDILFLSVIVADADNHFLRSFITRGNLSSYGLLFFVFTQSLVLAKNFSRSFSKAESLKEELQELNISLEEKVNERTLALETSKAELEKAYQAVSRSEKSLQNLTQNISHDLRTPLTAIKGYVNAILDGVVTEPQQQNIYLQRVASKVNNINYMVQELLNLSQLQSRQLKLNLTQIPATLFIESFSEKYYWDMMHENFKFKVNYPPAWQNGILQTNNLYVKVDTHQLERVFANLLSNAIKHSSEGSNIDLSFNYANDRKSLLVQVSDTGTGIPSEDLPHIFDRFYMASKARQTETNNSGLGLAIVKEIIEYHGGQIWVESEFGQGSSFCFSLPIFNNN